MKISFYKPLPTNGSSTIAIVCLCGQTAHIDLSKGQISDRSNQISADWVGHIGRIGRHRLPQIASIGIARITVVVHAIDSMGWPE